VITDDVVVNQGSLRRREFNPHSAAGYLSHPKVRRSVYESTHFDAMARFVVARDVAEVLGVDQRHPVLIEVLEPGYPALGEQPRDRDRREEKEQKRGPISLAGRIERAAADLGTLVRATARESGGTAAEATRAVSQASIDPLRRFVAAHLTPTEIREVAHEHKEFNVYAVWRSAAKRKLLNRSRAVLQADAALDSYSARGHRITWAVLDTGIRSTHPHFLKRIAAIWDCTQTGPPARLESDDDRDGHGSHVAGIIAGASEKDGEVISGVAPDAELVIYKVLNDRGEGEDAWIIKALDHIAAQNDNNASLAIQGLNLSLGGPYDSTVYGCGFTPICQELRRQWRSGVLVVVACGNEGQLEVQTRNGDVEINTAMSIGDPANLEDCIAVGSVNADRPHLYGISPFSSRGPTSDGRCKPDVVAPGERITSVNARFSGAQRLHRVESGTSMAAPHVSGLLAAFLSVRREFIGRPDEVKKLLLDTCTDLGRDRQHQGRGMPNLMKMLLSV
jgi:subtilisin family serine protease